jgi:heat shock protein HslJ
LGPVQEPQPALPEARVDLVFDQQAGRVAGKAGCNRYFGGYTREGTTLTIGQAGATRMACAEAVMRQEAAYLAALGTVSGYTIDGDLLELSYDGGVLRFRAG